MELTIGSSKVVFFDSIKSLPNTRRFLSNNYQLWISGVGNKISQIQSNIGNAYAYLGANRTKDGLTFLQNADYGLEALKQEEDFELKQLACYLKSIDGIETNVSTDNIDEVAEQLNMTGITIGQVEETLAAIKKKYSQN